MMLINVFLESPSLPTPPPASTDQGEREREINSMKIFLHYLL